MDGAALERALWSLRAYDTVALATVSDAGPHVAAYYFAPERSGEALRLLIAMPPDSRKLRDISRDPRVGFLCHPGGAQRWVTGRGSASRLRDQENAGLAHRLLTHAPGAQPFIDGAEAVFVELSIEHLEVVDNLGSPTRVLDF